jgi:hypothetical protein
VYFRRGLETVLKLIDFSRKDECRQKAEKKNLDGNLKVSSSVSSKKKSSAKPHV